MRHSHYIPMTIPTTILDRTNPPNITALSKPPPHTPQTILPIPLPKTTPSSKAQSYRDSNRCRKKIQNSSRSKLINNIKTINTTTCTDPSHNPQRQNSSTHDPIH
ncbi:hypothetical protein KC19_3G163500 [Ceratodon purpureus]|uniref:Uncharacterized protein n=1 Tax=Ceratodon purpureus TaxID=3225 RepID=A0A8T0IKM0_CERPU|nr:hypothetical protein KC19_3G163500 [Ceratodon purpureus]